MHKESGFFHNDFDYEDGETLRKYMRLFPDVSSNQRYCVEATPTYLDSGEVTASRIERLLDEPKILLLLRDPTDRIVSYYRSKQGLESSLIYGLSFVDFVNKALAIASGKVAPETEQDRRIGLQVKKAYYAQFLSIFRESVPADRMHVMFFEDLRDDPHSLIRSLCTYLDLDSRFYNDYTFRVENRSRYHKSSKLRTLASKINSASEPVLNKIPSLRIFLRSVYNAVNTVPGKGQSFDQATLRKLRDHFRPHNEALRTLLERDFHVKTFPDWLSSG